MLAKFVYQMVHFGFVLLQKVNVGQGPLNVAAIILTLFFLLLWLVNALDTDTLESKTA